MRTVLSLVPVALLASLTACSHADAPVHAPVDVATPAVDTHAAPADVAIAAHQADALGFDLWKRAPGDGTSNLAMSPASIATAFAMTYLGAKGQTADEMKKVLHLDGTPAEVASSYATLLASYAARKGVDLAIANRLFGDKTQAFAPSFLDATRDGFGAELARLDFENHPEDARGFVNGWVADKTHDKIKDLLPSGSVDENTRLVLVNAIYFKGLWEKQFKKDATSNAAFTTATGARVDVPTMHQTSTFKIADDGRTTLLEMPYAGGELAMDILLPKDAASLAALEKSLDDASLDKLVDAAHAREVEVSLPRFHIAPPALALKRMLQSLGMKTPFDASSADFSGMDGARDLSISDAFHKAFVDVNEQGTEAAAATGVVMTREAMVVPARFDADHPFLFVLRDLKTHGVLFLGRVADPSRT